MAAKDTAEKPAAATAPASVTFADRQFKSRTVVLADGRAFTVEKGRIVAADPALIAYLDKDGSFERLPADRK